MPPSAPMQPVVYLPLHLFLSDVLESLVQKHASSGDNSSCCDQESEYVGETPPRVADITISHDNAKIHRKATPAPAGGGTMRRIVSDGCLVRLNKMSQDERNNNNTNSSNNNNNTSRGLKFNRWDTTSCSSVSVRRGWGSESDLNALPMPSSETEQQPPKRRDTTDPRWDCSAFKIRDKAPTAVPPRLRVPLEEHNDRPTVPTLTHDQKKTSQPRSSSSTPTLTGLRTVSRSTLLRSHQQHHGLRRSSSFSLGHTNIPDIQSMIHQALEEIVIDDDEDEDDDDDGVVAEQEVFYETSTTEQHPCAYIPTRC